MHLLARMMLVVDDRVIAIEFTLVWWQLFDGARNEPHQQCERPCALHLDGRIV